MSYGRRQAEEIPQENTAIWACTSEGCNGWMRDNFAFESVPICRLCESPMEQDMRVIPLLVNPNGDLRSLKKGIQIQEEA